MTPPAARFLALVVAALVAAGCATFPKTGQLAAYDLKAGYRYELLDGKDNTDDLFVVLTFSGGGTRAAALAYGVLEELRRTTVTTGGTPRNLLKEVDVLSSVSGGSFTAAYYALRGDEIFEPDGRFQRNFLYRDVQADLFWRVANPYNWLRLASPEFGRIELATELYQDLLFDDATFRDLERARGKPYLMVDATDMTKGAPFTFVQSQFDPLCADLGTVSVARAVAASSNFPIAFTPLTLNSYPGTCHYEQPPWVKPALDSLDVNPRRYYRARMLRSYEETDRRYVHLLDGGVADNIGLRGPLTSIESGDVTPSILNKMGLEEITTLVVIAVDAKNGTPSDFDRSPNPPGLVDVVTAIGTVPLENYSFDTLELLQDVLRRRDDAQRQAPDLHKVHIYRIYIGFDQIKDEAERARFFSIKTSFDIPKDEVDALRQKGAELLKQSPCFQALLGPAPVRAAGASTLCP
jgi:NTE family protein